MGREVFVLGHLTVESGNQSDQYSVIHKKIKTGTISAHLNKIPFQRWRKNIKCHIYLRTETAVGED